MGSKAIAFSEDPAVANIEGRCEADGLREKYYLGVEVASETTGVQRNKADRID